MTATGPAGWGVYMLRCADGSFYTGSTNDLRRRMAEHTAGTGARYTRGRLPVQVVYWEPCRDRAAAQQREAAVKSLGRPAKERLIAGAPLRP